MDKGTKLTIIISAALLALGIISAIVGGALWVRSGIAENGEAIAANAKAIEANTRAITELRMELRADIAELRGLIFSHATGHQHGVSDASGAAGGEQKPPSN